MVWPPRSLLSERIFETLAEADALCAACVADAPPYATARAALAYDDHAKKLVLDLKRGGRRDGLALFAGWMARAGAEGLAEADIVIPTPLHWTRLLERRFNQSAWLAEAVAKAAGKPMLVDALVRRRRRKSQGGLTASQRRRNVEGVFRVAPQGAFWAANRIEGRIVVLIDDVFTTGATAEACVKALLRAKAAKVHVLTLARVVRPVDVAI